MVTTQKVVAPRLKEISRFARNDSWKADVISTEGRDLYLPPVFENLRRRDSGELSGLARKNHHIRGASLGLQYYKAFASLTNTESIRSVAE